MKPVKRRPVLDSEAFKAAQAPTALPMLPVVICARCNRPAAVRVLYDTGWGEYNVTVGCHGEVQSVAIRAVTTGVSRALVLSIIESMGKVFQPC